MTSRHGQHSVLHITCEAKDDCEDDLREQLRQFYDSDNGGCLFRDINSASKYRMLRIVDHYDATDVNKFTAQIAKGLKAPPKIENWTLHGRSENTFRLAPCSESFTLTSTVVAGAPCDKLHALFEHFCEALDTHCIDFLSALLCSEPRKAQNMVIYHCIFFPTSMENWETFRSSKLFAEIRTRLLEISDPQRYPSFDQQHLVTLWDSHGVDICERDTTPRVHALEQMIPTEANENQAVCDLTKTLAQRPDLKRVQRFLEERSLAIQTRKEAYTACHTTGKSSTFLEACRFGLKFGAVREEGKSGVTFRDWVTGSVDQVIVRGEFSNWEDIPMTLDPETEYGFHTWSHFIPDGPDGDNKVKDGSKYQFKFVKDGDIQYRLPAYARHVHVDELNGNVDARVLIDTKEHLHQHSRPTTLNGDSPIVPVVYECHVGTSTASAERIGSFAEFQETVLPRVRAGGFNTICFMGISQHSSYSTFGWHVTSHYAPDIAFGSPDDLHRLVDECHKHGIRVWVSLVHSHCAPINGGGLQNYMQWGEEGYCPSGGAETTNKRFDAKKFAVERHEVMRYLLGSIVMWAEVYKVDGIRMENLHTMLFHHQGVGMDFGLISLDKHFDHEADLASHIYLALVGQLCRELDITAAASTECESPLLTTPVQEGGLGLDFIFSTAAQKLVQACISKNDWSHNFSVTKLAEIARLSITGNRTILSPANWDSCLYARRPMKIALLSWETLYTHPVGGVAPHVTELAAGLSRLGHEVHIFTRSTTLTANHSIHHGVHIHECPMQLNSDFVQEIKNMCSSLKSHLLQTESYMNDHFTIIHAHDWLAGPGLEGLRELGRTTVQTMHSTEYGRCGNQIFGGQSKAVRDVEGRSCDIADRVICVSGVLADEVKEHYRVHPEKIRVVYNGINAMNWDGFEDGAEIKARYGISAMQPMLLFVGRMVLQKGPDLLIDALPEIVAVRNDVVIVMVGDGHMLEELKQKSDQMGLSNNVKWLGKKGGAELHSLYKACDAVLVPSRNEPFGIVVLEAWACYKPVVATTCGGPRDFVSHNHEGYLVDPNPQSVAWGCKQILSNFEHTRWMGERGRVKAAFSFTWDRIATETRDVYLELLNRQDAPYGISPFCTRTGEQTMISQLIGPLVTCRMSVFDECQEVQTGIDFYNMIRLFIVMSSNGGHMSFMGCEFGQPDILDLPRPGNHFSKERARTNWDLPLATDLKFKYMGYWMAKINQAMDKQVSEPARLINVDGQSNTIVLQKGDFSAVFNFSRTSFEYFDVGFDLDTTDLKIVAASCEERFSGRAGFSEPWNLDVPVTHMEGDEVYMTCKKKFTVPLPEMSVLIIADKSALEKMDIGDKVDDWVKTLADEVAPLKATAESIAEYRQESVGRLRGRI